MKRIILAAALALGLAGCVRQESYDSGTAPANETGAAESRIRTTTNAGPDTAVGAATAASSGVGTATASGSTALESEAAAQNEIGKPVGENQNLEGTPAENQAGDRKELEDRSATTSPTR
jgi:hypothetical protein